MHDYYEWKDVLFNRKYPNCLIPMKYEIMGSDYRCLYQCAKVNNWSADNKAYFDSKNQGSLCDHLRGIWDIHFVKEGLKNYLAEVLGDQVQFLPITLVDEHDNTSQNRDYNVLVALHQIDCADRESTQIAKISERGIIMLRYGYDVVLKRSLIPIDVRIFMLKNPSCYILRGDLVRELKKRKFTGLVFKKLEVT